MCVCVCVCVGVNAFPTSYTLQSINCTTIEGSCLLRYNINHHNPNPSCYLEMDPIRCL